jgi:hypothetical protein
LVGRRVQGVGDLGIGELGDHGGQFIDGPQRGGDVEDLLCPVRLAGLVEDRDQLDQFVGGPLQGHRSEQGLGAVVLRDLRAGLRQDVRAVREGVVRCGRRELVVVDRVYLVDGDGVCHGVPPGAVTRGSAEAERAREVADCSLGGG